MSEWKELTLEAVCSCITDGAHNSPPSVSEGKPMASVKDLTSFGIRIESCRRIRDVDFEKLVRQGCQPVKGDVLIAKDGATALDTVCEVKQNVDVVLLSSVAILRPNPTVINSSYLRYYLDASTTRGYLKGSFISGAAIPRVVLKDLKRAKVRVPSLPVQQRIAGILSAYDDLIENNQRRIRILESMARALYREWFVHFRFPGHENLPRVPSTFGEIPQGWEVTTFGELYNTGSGGTPSRTRPEYFENGTIDWVKSQELLDGFILSTEERITVRALKESSAKLFPANSVLIALYGATIGKLAILSRSAATNQACCAILPKSESFGREFAFLMLLSNREKIISLRLGAAQQNISQVLLRNLECLKPADDLVRSFSIQVAPFFNGILTLQYQIQNLRSMRDQLLARLLSGQIKLNGN